MNDSKASKKPQLIHTMVPEEENKSVENSETDADDTGVPLGLTRKAVFMQVREVHFCFHLISDQWFHRVKWFHIHIKTNRTSNEAHYLHSANHRPPFLHIDEWKSVACVVW